MIKTTINNDKLAGGFKDLVLFQPYLETIILLIDKRIFGMGQVTTKQIDYYW